MSPITTRTSSALAVAAVATLALAGCASSTTAGTDATSSPAADAYTIPQQTGAPPWAFTNDADELVGMLPELSLAVGVPMGVSIENERTTWENSLLGLESGKYMFVPGADATPERLEKFDFAIAMKDGYSFEVPVGGDEIGDTMMDLCGLTIGLVTGSSPIPTLEAQSTECETAGEQPIVLSTFPDWASSELAAQSGQIDAATNTLSSIQYQAEENPGKWIVTGPTFQETEVGFAVLKGSEWGPKLVDALNAIIADGTYADIFDTYGTTGMMVEESRLVTE
jgi:polar amino acid transport system substrate-binding protein